MSIEIRPPRPGMVGKELDQFLDRLYRAVQALSTGGDVTVVDHNDLENNGGDNSHASISSHIANDSAHGAASGVVGESETQTLSNKTISALNNSISGLRHGHEVDEPTSAHGVTEVVGTSETQTLTNKTINRSSNTISGLRHGHEVDEPAEAHGVTLILGSTEVQNVFNKRVLEPLEIITANHDMTGFKSAIQVEALATVKLPSPNVCTGQQFSIDNKHTATITVIPFASETIQGETSQGVPPDCCMVVRSDGINWRII